MNTCIALGCLKAYLKFSAGWCNINVIQKGKTALVAGASKRPGYQIAENLANRGCRIIIADRENLHETRDRLIAQTGNKRIDFKHVDFYKLDTVRRLARDIQREEEHLNMLIYTDNVSGLDSDLTEDGFQKVVQYNNLAPFLLTYELADLMKKTPNSRIVFRSNILAYLHQITSPEDINRLPSYNHRLLQDFYGYCNSSALTLMTMACFAELVKEQSVCCCAAHPGFMDMSVTDSSKDIKWKNLDAIPQILFGKILPTLLRLFGKTDKEAAQTAIHAAVSPEEREITGKFLADCRVIMQPPSAQVHLFRMKIFEEMKRMVLQEQKTSRQRAAPAPISTSITFTAVPISIAPVIEEPHLTNSTLPEGASEPAKVNPILVSEPISPQVVQATEPKLEPTLESVPAEPAKSTDPTPNVVSTDSISSGGGQPYIAPSIIQRSTNASPAGTIDATSLMSDTRGSASSDSIKPFNDNIRNKD